MHLLRGVIKQLARGGRRTAARRGLTLHLAVEDTPPPVMTSDRTVSIRFAPRLKSAVLPRLGVNCRLDNSMTGKA